MRDVVGLAVDAAQPLELDHVGGAVEGQLGAPRRRDAGTTRWVSTFVPTWAPWSLITELNPAMRCTKLSRYSCRMAGRVT